MKVGIFITNQHTLATDMVSALEDQFVMVRHARDRGWDSLMTGQHYLNEGDNKQLQAVPLLARLAAEAGEMTLGLGILLLNLHNPVYTAETVASLDVIARGNFIFGVGLGYREVEFDAFGVPKGVRVKRLEEYLTLVERLWTEDRVSYDGPGCRLDNVHMNIRPVQKPRPPVLVGGAFPWAARRAIRYGDGWFPIAGGTRYGDPLDYLPRFRQMAEEAGRDPAALPVTLGGAPEDADVLKRYRDLGVARVNFPVPPAKADEVLPILDRLAKLRQQLQ